MSLRPEICGFDLAAWRGLLGSGQDSAKASLRAALSEPAQAEALAIAIRAIDEGAPFTDVQVEGAHHVRAAIELANLVPQVATGSNVWKYGAFANFAAQFTAFAKVTNPFSRFLGGRARFGREINANSWRHYGWLDREELRQLRMGLNVIIDGIGAAPVYDHEDVGEQLRTKGSALTSPLELPAYFEELLAAHAQIGPDIRPMGIQVAWRLECDKQVLKEYMERVLQLDAKADPFDGVREFATELDGWCAIIEDAKLDLWFYFY